MRFEDAVAEIRARYAANSGFPYNDWTTNPQSFYSLISFWDEMFRLASDTLYDDYAAVQDATQDANSPIYFVQNAAKTKKIRLWHGLSAEGEPDVAFFWGRYPDLSKPDPGGRGYSKTLEGVYVFEIASDFEPDRLVAAGAMMHHFVHFDTSTHERQAELERKFEAWFRRYFPLPEIDLSDDED